MPIQYAEITILINLEKEPIMNYFNRLLGNENETNDNDTIIILFEDSIICDVKKECTNSKIIMGPKCYDRRYLPFYFEMKDTHKTFFSKSPKTNSDGTKKMNFNPIFNNYKKHMTTIKETSVYNCIYYFLTLKDKIDVLAVVKIKSHEEKPMFFLAYNDEYFEKENIIYFINYIFSTK